MKHWIASASISLSVGTLVLLGLLYRPAPKSPTAAIPPTGLVQYGESIPINTDEQLQALETQAVAIGFETAWFKDGPDGGGHSLVGKYESVDFRLIITHRIHRATFAIEVSLLANANSLGEAKNASSNLLSRLTK